jgi:TonB family protein
LQGSYTLSAIEIEKVRLTRHKVELSGLRYGLHFVGKLGLEDPSKAFDRVRITPRKKVVKITIEREIVVKPKEKKQSKAEKERDKKAGQGAVGQQAGTGQPRVPIAAAPAAEHPANPGSEKTAQSPAQATKVLKDALDKVFAGGLDDRMMAAMPDFWKLYYRPEADEAGYGPKDPSVLRQNTVDQKAQLLTKFEPESNEFAQANGVAGMALYHIVVGNDGKAGEIAVGRPIGFGLDENAVAAIRKASFQPAMKDGKPVPVLLDLVVQFRIFSKRTAAVNPPEAQDKPAATILPGPYSVTRP